MLCRDDDGAASEPRLAVPSHCALLSPPSLPIHFSDPPHLVRLVCCSPTGPFKNLPCNTFSWCAEEVCFVPDAHHHTKGDCWIKFTEGPAYPEVRWRSGVGTG